MFRKGGMFEEIVEQGGSVTKQVGQTVKKAPTDMAKAAVSQVAGSQTPTDTPLDAIQQDSGDAQDFVKDLYGAKKPGSTPAHPTSKTPVDPTKLQNAKTPEEAEKLESLRRELHSDYYQKLTHPDKQQELRPAEKVEEEKKKEMIELQEKEAKKPAPLSVQRAQNKAEQFRGVSG